MMKDVLAIVGFCSIVWTASKIAYKKGLSDGSEK